MLFRSAILCAAVGLAAGCGGLRPAAVSEAPAVSADEAFLDTLEHRTFRWFWETTDATTGLTPDRWPTRTFSSVAAIGFGLTANGIGAEREYVPRDSAAARTLSALRYLWRAPQGTDQVGMTGYKGFFYHFLEQDTGVRFRDVELSSIDTGLLMMGVLFVREYFDLGSPREVAIRAYADSLYQRVEWDWFQAQSDLITMAWRPEEGYGRAEYQGYNEAMFLYLLALGSPTYPVSDSAWAAFTRSYTWGDYYGYEHVNFSPLFGHQYTHSWVDLRGVQDDYMRARGIDYFENSRRAALSQRAYATANPLGWRDYGSEIWGLTACDGPTDGQFEYAGEMRTFRTYSARGASLEYVNDDGTIAPTAAGASIAFAPEVVLPTLRAMVERYGEHLYTEYGFKDAFNPSFSFTPRVGTVVPGLGWFDRDYLGIDQGPILLMVENHRSGLVWETIARSPYLVRGLRRAGFAGGWLDGPRAADPPVVIGARMPAPDADDGIPLVVVLGSSSAEGEGPEHADSTWANRLRAALRPRGARLLNLARGGYTTFQLIPTGATHPAGRPAPDDRRNITAALARLPAAIVLSLPSNDAAAGFSNEEQLANYARIMEAAESAGVPLWITTTGPRDLDDAGRAAQAALRDELMARYPGRVIDVWDGIARVDGRLDPRWDSGDALHVNDAAHALIYRRILSAGLLDTLPAR
jgi:lysophospholipase L1-like esterase